MKTHFYSFCLILFFACDADEISRKDLKLDYYTESLQTSGSDFKPQLKVEYEYDIQGKLIKYRFYGYNTTTQTLEEQRYFVFQYDGKQVSKVEGFLPGATTAYITDKYDYTADGRVSKIKEENPGAGITSEAIFAYNSSGDSLKVTYTNSNGTAFDYTVKYEDHNIVADKTSRGTQLCSTGSYTYDRQKNPFYTLGYTDFLLTNASVNNKTAENINYVGCSFPSLIPESYTYEYNTQGYPTVAITNYKASGSTSRKSKKEFFYK
jgi:hypothetical protein